MQATIAFQELTTALHEITFSSATINRTEAASRASYLPLYHSYSGLLAERDDVLQEIVDTNNAVRDTRGAWENEQEAVRSDIASYRQDAIERRDDAQAVRNMRPVTPRNQCRNGQVVHAEFRSTQDCYAAWDAFFSARGAYYAEHGSHYNLVGHIAAANEYLANTDSNTEVEALVMGTPAVQEALSRYQDAVAVHAASNAMARLTHIDTVALPAALAALMAHPYFN